MNRLPRYWWTYVLCILILLEAVTHGGPTEPTWR